MQSIDDSVQISKLFGVGVKKPKMWIGPPIVFPKNATFLMNPDTYSLVLRNRNLIDCISIHADSIQVDHPSSGIEIRDHTGKGGITLNADDNLITLRNKDDKRCIFISADRSSGIVLVDQNGEGGITMNADNYAFIIWNKEKKKCIEIHADPLNGSGIELRDHNEQDTIHLNGEKGDIWLLNADCAEDLEVIDAELVEPGTVMTLTDDGKLVQGTRPYDKRVAGVVSGACNLKPGLILGREKKRNNKLPIALTGTVYCKVDATFGAIEVGDLLTTSTTPGHAMKATDSLKAFGAVIGKALRPFNAGCGFVPILVALQ